MDLLFRRSAIGYQRVEKWMQKGPRSTFIGTLFETGWDCLLKAAKPRSLVTRQHNPSVPWPHPYDISEEESTNTMELVYKNTKAVISFSTLHYMYSSLQDSQNMWLLHQSLQSLYICKTE